MNTAKRLLLVLAFAPLATFAEGVAIKPGKWEFTTTSVSQLNPEPTVEVAQHCMTGEPYNPAAKLAGDCKVAEQKLNGNRLTWKVVCETEIGPAEGNGEFSATDTNAEGFLNMMMHFSGQDIPVKTTWRGEYLGACDT